MLVNMIFFTEKDVVPENDLLKRIKRIKRTNWYGKETILKIRQIFINLMNNKWKTNTWKVWQNQI